MPQVNPIIKRGLQNRASQLILSGKTTTAIAKELGISRGALTTYKRAYLKAGESLQTDGLKATMRMELSRENAISEIIDQLYEYTQNYRNAMARGDEELAGKWANLRTKLGETWVKVTGLDRVIAAEPRQVEVTWHFVTQNPPQN